MSTSPRIANCYPLSAKDQTVVPSSVCTHLKNISTNIRELALTGVTICASYSDLLVPKHSPIPWYVRSLWKHLLVHGHLAPHTPNHKT